MHDCLLEQKFSHLYIFSGRPCEHLNMCLLNRNLLGEGKTILTFNVQYINVTRFLSNLRTFLLLHSSWMDPWQLKPPTCVAWVQITHVGGFRLNKMMLCWMSCISVTALCSNFEKVVEFPFIWPILISWTAHVVSFENVCIHSKPSQITLLFLEETSRMSFHCTCHEYRVSGCWSHCVQS